MFQQPMDMNASQDQCETMESLSSNIDALEAERSALLTRLAKVDELASAAKAKYSRMMYGRAAVASLPDEVLKLIFEAGDLVARANYEKSFGRLISHVTQHWRRIALQTPRLWTQISCRIHPPHELGAMDAYLQRSAPYPIDLTIRVDEDTCLNYVPEWMEVYIDAVGRCWRLRISIGYETSDDDIESLFDFLESTSAPRLSTFEVYRDWEMEHASAGAPLTFLKEGAPLLRSVRLENPCPACWLPPLTNVSVLQLVFPFKGFRAPDVRIVLESAPALTDLQIHGSYLFSGWKFNLAAIDLPLLRTLSLASYWFPKSLLLLRAINAPSLETLCIRGFEAHDNPFEKLPEPKYPNLRSLIWLDQGGEPYQSDPSDLATQLPQSLILLSKAFPTVERLVYGGPHVEELPRLLKEEDVTGDVRRRSLRTLALRCKANSASASPAIPTIDEARAFMAHRRDVGAPVQVVFLPAELMPAFQLVDHSGFPDVQQYLNVLDDTEAGMHACRATCSPVSRTGKCYYYPEFVE